MGPVPALMGKVPLRLSLTFSLQLASLWAFVSFVRKRRALPLKARECNVRSHKGDGITTLYTSESTD